MQLEPGIDPLDQANESDVLDDGRVYAAIDRLAEQEERVDELVRLEERVEGEVDARSPAVRDAAGRCELIERELGTLIPSVEPFCPEIHGVRAIGDGSADRVERAGWGEELGERHSEI
jgi:hypothetical protein